MSDYLKSVNTDEAEPVLKMEGITKDFSDVTVLDGVDFELRRGEVMALMGENGAGKSTLMKILAGVHTDWKGRVCINGRESRFENTKEAEHAGIAIIYQELNLIPGLSVAENIFLGREPSTYAGMVDFKLMNERAEKILDGLHFTGSVQNPVSQLRVGHQQLVEIGKALSLNARILVMDEPTSALSEKETEILFSVVRKLKEQGVSIIYISHRISEVFSIADRITVLRDGKSISLCNTNNVTRQELIKMMVGRELKQFFVREGKPQEKIAIEVDNIKRDHPYKTDKLVVDDVSFRVRKGEILGIAGLLGAGRTELLESIFGAASSDSSGNIKIEGEEVKFNNPLDAINAGIALITEDRKGNGLVMGLSVEYNMTLAALNKIVLHNFIISKSKERQLADSNVKSFSINVSNLNNSIESLSGGNQQKVLLAKWLSTNPKILLLDDPTRGVDVGAKHEIYVLLSELAQKGLAIVMASSELPELLSICDRIIVLREGKLSAEFNHNEATNEKILEAAAPIN